MWYVDISSMKWVGISGKKYWALFVDASTGFTVSKFLENKDDLEEVGLEVCKKLRAMGITAKITLRQRRRK